MQPLVSTRELAIVWPFIHEQIDERSFARARWVWLPGLVGEVVLLADLQWMVIEVGVAFSCWLLSMAVGEELGDQL